MFVQQILDFIKTFETEELISSDVKLIENLLARFTPKLPENSLAEDDIQFLLACYKNRWDAIADSENDYTRNPSRINQRWIDLAREIGTFTKENYLRILIPTLSNDKDLNDFSSLNETVNLFNFYLGYGVTPSFKIDYGANVLFRKWSLCEHLKTWQFALSTYRSLGTRRLSPLTVDELARLKLCQQTTREVTVGAESFANFWDFMRKKVFINLKESEHGHIPIGLLPPLLELIERYYYLRAHGSDFTIFKNEVKIFFDRLYGHKLFNVNFMYGAKVEYKEREEYLLDVFIALYTANEFTLDLEMNALARWLFQFNPVLRASSRELEPIYHELRPTGSLAVVITSQYPEALAHCCGLLVSLLTTQFEISAFFSRHNYSVWDKQNNVFSEACGIFTILLPLIAANRPDDIASAYGNIIRDIIAPARRDRSWYTWFTRNKQTVRWLELAYSHSLNELDVYWFEPELIFSALLYFNVNNQVLKPYINNFLDEIIHTYAQDQNDLMKQFRVNILFSEFMRDLSDTHRRSLLMWVKLCDLKTAKSNFLNNCTTHINNRLFQLCQSQSEGASSHFFSFIPKLDSDRSFVLPERSRTVEAMLIEYNKQLLTFGLSEKLFDQVSDYLVRKVGRPILTCTQKEAVKSNPVAYDYYMGRYYN